MEYQNKVKRREYTIFVRLYPWEYEALKKLSEQMHTSDPETIRRLIKVFS